MIDIRRLGPASLALLSLRDCGVICSWCDDSRFRDLCDLKMDVMDMAAPLDRERDCRGGKADFRITKKGDAALKRELAFNA